MQRHVKNPGLNAQGGSSGEPRPIKLGAAEWGLIALQSMAWGTAFFFGAIALKDLPPLTIAGFRLIPAFLVVLIACLIVGVRLPLSGIFWRRMLFLGLCNNVVPIVLILWAQYRVAGGVAGVFNATSPLFAVVIAHFATRDEKLSIGKVAGLLTGVVGVSVLVGADVTSGTTGDSGAKLALLAAAVLYGIAGIYARRCTEPPFAIAGGQILAALVISLPLALVIDQPWTVPMPGWPAIAAVIAMGTISSGFAALIFFTVLRRAGATNALLTTLLLPLTPIALGALFLGEMLSGREVAGAVIIGLALIILDGRLLRGRLGR